jgi:Protein of unknown function (DUF2948)
MELPMTSLRLIALDEQDLAVVSAHCQDAVLSAGDLVYLKDEKRFVLTMNRFVWEKSVGRGAKVFERRRAVLHFERVDHVRQIGINRGNRNQVLSLLAITFTAGDFPAGIIEIAFAGGATIHLEVECIECRLGDLAAAWQTESRPDHPS